VSSTSVAILNDGKPVGTNESGSEWYYAYGIKDEDGNWLVGDGYKLEETVVPDDLQTAKGY
jgi:hypothetical protein